MVYLLIYSRYINKLLRGTILNTGRTYRIPGTQKPTWYIFLYFYQHYLALFTMVPRNTLFHCVYRSSSLRITHTTSATSFGLVGVACPVAFFFFFTSIYTQFSYAFYVLSCPLALICQVRNERLLGGSRQRGGRTEYAERCVSVQPSRRNLSKKPPFSFCVPLKACCGENRV